MSKKPPNTDTQHLPFQFSGGFGWSNQTIEAFLAAQGVLQMFVQGIIFPSLNRRFGSLQTFWITLCLYPVLYLFAPYLALLPETFRILSLMVLPLGKVTFQLLSYPSLAIILTNSSPSKRVLGTLNGVAMSSASIVRGFSPTVSGTMDSLGDTLGMSGLAWWAIAGVALIGWMPGFALKQGDKWTGFRSQKDEEILVDTASDAEFIITLATEETVERVLSE